MKLFNFPRRPARGIWRRSLIVLLAVLLFAALASGVLAQSGSDPAEPADAAAGLAIHAERCANCHGEIGLGDGDLAVNLPNPPAAHGSAEYIRAAVPAEMFETITTGRIEKGMPPFGPASSNPLSDEQRWDTIAALYTFGTPIESVERGQAVYEENCLACHGESGMGDGPEADPGSDPGDLTSLAYWSHISNQAVFDNLAADGQVAGHQFELPADDLWSVTDYIRTFSYNYVDALARFRPLEKAAISGLASNGTLGEPVAAGTVALLRAFTQDLNITLTMTDTVDAEGLYHFDLTDVPQDWFYRISVDHDGVEFGSDFAQLSFDEPAADLPLTVYETTSDPSAISIQQVHIVLAFDDEHVQVSELYVVGNNDQTVFVGESGDANRGTFRISVPAEAQQVLFQRGFGSLDSFVPASEVIPTGSDWSDTLPLRPGSTSLLMLAQYVIPYEKQATISHPVNYNLNGVNLVIPEVGVSLDVDGGWLNTGSQAMGDAGTMSTYVLEGLPSGDSLTIGLEGRPRATTNTAGRVIQDNTTEILIGAAVALVVVGVAAVAVRQWRQVPDEGLDRDELLQAIADLDDEYEAGEIGDRAYKRERQALLAALTELWEEEEE